MRVPGNLTTTVIKLNEVYISDILRPLLSQDGFINELRDADLIMDTDEPMNMPEEDVYEKTYLKLLLSNPDQCTKYYQLLDILRKHTTDQVKDYMNVADLRQYSALSVEALYRHYTIMRPMLDTPTANAILQQQNQQERRKLDNLHQKRVSGIVSSESLVPTVLNIVLLGKTGSGKSATGNMISGIDAFPTSNSDIACTPHIQLSTFVLDGVQVNVIDTPGLMDLKKTRAELVTEVGKVIDEFSDGIDAFIYVYNISDPRYTEEDHVVFSLISKEIFGSDSTKHCFAVLTHVEGAQEFNTLRNYLNQNSNSCFKKLLNETLEGRVMAVNNYEPSIYGMTEQRRNFIRFIVQNIEDRYLSERFVEFQRRKEDLCRNHPVCVRHLVPLIDELTSALLQNLSRSEIRDIQSRDRLNMADWILQQIKYMEEVLDVWENIIIQLTVDCLLEKIDCILTYRIRSEDDIRLKALSKEEDKLRLEVRLKSCQLMSSDTLAADVRDKLEKDIESLSKAAAMKQKDQIDFCQCICKKEKIELMKDIVTLGIVAVTGAAGAVIAGVAAGVAATEAAVSFGLKVGGRTAAVAGASTVLQGMSMTGSRINKIHRWAKRISGSKDGTYSLIDHYGQDDNPARDQVGATEGPENPQNPESNRDDRTVEGQASTATVVEGETEADEERAGDTEGNIDTEIENEEEDVSEDGTTIISSSTMSSLTLSELHFDSDLEHSDNLSLPLIRD